MARTRIDLSDIVESPEFSQTITIVRDKQGYWFQGKYINQQETITTTGVISATDEKEIEFLPEGDRASETKKIHTTIPLYTTRGGNPGFKADVVIWNNEVYKIIKVQRSGDYGYWSAIISKIGTKDEGDIYDI